MSDWTPGPWHCGHFADPKHSCNCRSITSESYMGGICEIDVDNGKLISDGGNDAPPLQEAIANARLISAAPELYEALEAMLSAYCGYSHAGWQQGAARFDARSALAKARGETSWAS